MSVTIDERGIMMIGRIVSRFVTTIGMSVILFAMSACTTVAHPLETTEWKLVEWTLSSIRPHEFAIRAKFESGQVSGFSGVNTYSGPFQGGTDGEFSAGPFSRSKKGHTGDAMRAEDAYLTLLAQAKSYESTGNRLTLHDAGGNESLVFEAVGR